MKKLIILLTLALAGCGDSQRLQNVSWECEEYTTVEITTIYPRYNGSIVTEIEARKMCTRNVYSEVEYRRGREPIQKEKK